jgi:hypothetical protein
MRKRQRIYLSHASLAILLINLIGYQKCIKISRNKTRRKDTPERLKHRKKNNNIKIDINKSDGRVWTGFI